MTTDETPGLDEARAEWDLWRERHEVLTRAAAKGDQTALDELVSVATNLQRARRGYLILLQPVPGPPDAAPKSQ